MSYIKHFSQKLIRHPVFSGSYVNKLRDSFSITKRRTCNYNNKTLYNRHAVDWYLNQKAERQS